MEIPNAFLAWMGFGAVAALYLELRYRTFPDQYNLYSVRNLQTALCPPVIFLFGFSYLRHLFRRNKKPAGLTPLVKKITSTFEEDGRWIQFTPRHTDNPYLKRRCEDEYYDMHQVQEAESLYVRSGVPLNSLPVDIDHIHDTRTNLIIRLDDPVWILKDGVCLTDSESRYIRSSWATKRTRDRRAAQEKARHKIERQY